MRLRDISDSPRLVMMLLFSDRIVLSLVEVGNSFLFDSRNIQNSTIKVISTRIEDPKPSRECINDFDEPIGQVSDDVSHCSSSFSGINLIPRLSSRIRSIRS